MERVGQTHALDEVLTTEQRDAMARVLREEEARREHIVIYLSGAHAYGFPSPDSDLDLKSIHVAPTAELVGLEAVPPTVDRAEVLDGVEIDYTSNELAHALAGALGGNGNFLERVLGRTAALESEWLRELRPLLQHSLSRRLHRHYRGFALNQLRFLEREPSVKKLLYVLRTGLTGLHALSTGIIEADLTRVMGIYGFDAAAELIERKKAGERTGLEPELLETWRPRLDELFLRLDEAGERSPLPVEPPNGAEILEWLLTVRRARF